MKKKQVEIYKSELIDKIYLSISPLEEKKVEIKMLIAAKIAEAIKVKNWKNTDLLKALSKKNPSIVTRWLSGTHNFTLDTLIELEEILEIELINTHEIIKVEQKNEEYFFNSINQLTIQINSEIKIPIYSINKFIQVNEPRIVYTTQSI